MNQPLIESKELQRFFPLPEGVVKAVDTVSLQIFHGEFVAVMGPSGSGKSTLLYVLGAMDRPTGGSVNILNQDLGKMTDNQLSEFRNLTVGFVFQSFHLLPRLSVKRNIELPMLYSAISPSQREKRVKSLMRALGISDRGNRLPTEISGGQSQRAAIARALVNDPKLILADEPTGNLDSRTGLEVMGIFQALNSRTRTLIMVTHDEIMARHATRVVRMRDGKIVDDIQVRDRLIAPPPNDFDPEILETDHVSQ